MAITTVPSVVTGQTYSAANFNTHIRDNINGIWVLTTAGDMLYATGASAAARLALVPGGVMIGGASAPQWLSPTGSQGKSLQMGTTYPQWGGYVAGKAIRSTNQSIANLTTTSVQFDSISPTNLVTWSSGDNTKLTLGVTGLYLYGFYASIDGGSGYRQFDIYKNGVLISDGDTRISTADTETTYQSITHPPSEFAAGDYLQLKVTHNNGSSINLRAARLWALLLE